MDDEKIHIALLRGINVSGQKKIIMKELCRHLAGAGLKDVTSYIQSGNLLYRAKSSLTEQQELIGRVIREHYGYHVDVLALTVAQLWRAADNNTFLNDRNEDPAKCYVTFLFDEPDQEQISHLSTYSYPPEEYILDGRILYFFSPDGYGKAKMNNNFFENKLKVRATTRNWKTVEQLCKMSLNIKTD